MATSRPRPHAVGFELISSNITRLPSGESIKRQLRARFANSKDFIVLIGEKTKNLMRFVRWEMEVAMNLGLPIIAVNLNGSRQQDTPIVFPGDTFQREVAGRGQRPLRHFLGP